MPVFRVKSVKIYTGQKNLHEYTRGVRDKYQVCFKEETSSLVCQFDFKNILHPTHQNILRPTHQKIVQYIAELLGL